MTRRLPIMISALLTVVAAVALTGSSSASFVSSTSSTGTVTAAADWTAPTATVTSPTSVLKGSATITASATDADSGVATVTIQRAAAGSSEWTTICVANTAPFTCSWSTTSVADGAYDLRAVVVDKAGNTKTSASARATVANALTVVLARPSTILSGTVTATTTVSNVGTLAPTVSVQYAPAGSAAWNTLCTVAAAPYSCSVDSRLAANGSYDLRSVATVGGATYTSAIVAGVLVDNLAPTVTMTDPGTPLKGTKTFSAAATDAHSGIAKVVIQSSTGGAWTNLCTSTATTTPFGCAVDTTDLDNGTYSFRAVATDKAGNTTTSAAVTNRVVHNAVTTVSLTPPASHLRGTVTLSAATTTTGTIASVKIQRSIAGSNAWTDICTDTTAPYTCSFATGTANGVPDGAYDLRAVATDSDGRTTTSAVVSNRIVDNTRGAGVDIQTTNGGTAGRIDTGDTMIFTFSEQMDLSTIFAGWSGTATSGTVQVRDGFVYGGGVDNDVLDLTRPSGADLGSVALDANFVTLFTVSTNMTMTATTVTEGGVARTVVTVRIDGGSIGNRVTSSGTMTWTPSADILDQAGNPISTAPVTESGPQDVDF